MAQKKTPPSVTVDLTTPVENGDKKITTITLRKPNPMELRGIKISQFNDGDITFFLPLWERIADTILTEQQWREVEPFDMVKMMEHTMLFFEKPESTA